jgi:DNA polymerase
MKRLWIDFETRSDMNLPDTGLDRYAKHSGTEVLMLAWAFDDAEPVLWQPRLGPMPPELHNGLIDDAVLKCAWNYNFEKDILEYRLGYQIPQEQWYDPSILCAYMSLPIGLDRAANALDIDIEVKKTHLVGKGNPKDLFCKPSKTLKKMLKLNPEMGPTYYKNWESHPEKWMEFEEYCIQDVRAERAVWYEATALNCPMTVEEMEAWLLDQRMNERGVYVDQTFVANAKKYAIEESDEIIEQMKKLTGLDNPNSGPQLLSWLQPLGYKSDSVDKENIENAVSGKLHGSKSLPEVAMTVLKLKQRLGGSAYKKLQSIEDRIGPDGRLRDQFVYHGAHTGRWSGRGVQLQNLFKPDKNASTVSKQIIEGIVTGTLDIKKIVADYNIALAAKNALEPDPKKHKKPLKDITQMTAIASVIRAAFHAKPGHRFIIGDLAQIESRVLAALAGCEEMIQAYKNGHDLYKEFMSWLLDKPVDQIDSDERSRGKVVILGCGFGMGVDKFIEYAASFGIEMDEAGAKEAVYGFRKKYVEISGFWKEIDQAVRDAVRSGCRVYCRGLVVDGRNPKMLKIQLPSGRYLHYLKPHLTMEERFGRMVEGVSYEAWDAKGRQLKRLYGGLITENIVQAVARDLLLNGMLEAEKEGIPIVMTIHDEIVGEVPEDCGYDHKKLLECMTRTPAWAEGMGFILAAEGDDSPYYKK